jgi:integrase
MNTLDVTKILTRQEVRTVLAWLNHRRRRGPNVLVNRTIFRLSCCCGLRVCEIVGLNLGDVALGGPRPHIKIRKGNTKGRRFVSPSNPEGKDYRKARTVPLWWDAGTLVDLAAYKALRTQETGNDPQAAFVVGARQDARQRLTTDGASKRWRALMKVTLGEERARQLSIHCGRHSFQSHAAAAGRSVVEIMAAVGHTNPLTTARYLHVLEAERAVDVFA